MQTLTTSRLHFLKLLVGPVRPAEINFIFIQNLIPMRNFLVNFVYTSAGQYNGDFVLFKQESFPTPREIYKHIKSSAAEKGLQVHGALLWTGINELSEEDEGEFKFEEE